MGEEEVFWFLFSAVQQYIIIFLGEMSNTTAIQFLMKLKLFLEVASTKKLLQLFFPGNECLVSTDFKLKCTSETL